MPMPFLATLDKYDSTPAARHYPNTRAPQMIEVANALQKIKG